MKAVFEGNFTNHSHRRSSATRLYQSGVPEQVNVETTGHRSIVEKDVEGKDKQLFENHVKYNEEKKMRVNA